MGKYKAKAIPGKKKSFGYGKKKKNAGSLADCEAGLIWRADGTSMAPPGGGQHVTGVGFALAGDRCGAAVVGLQHGAVLVYVQPQVERAPGDYGGAEKPGAAPGWHAKGVLACVVPPAPQLDPRKPAAGQGEPDGAHRAGHVRDRYREETNALPPSGLHC